MFSEDRQHGIEEQEAGGVRGGRTYEGRASIDLSQSLQLAKNTAVDKNVSLFIAQVSVDIKDGYYRQHFSFYLMEGLLLDSESIHGVATSISYEEQSTTLYQVFTLSPAVTFEQLRAAITKTVKLITNMNDVVVSLLLDNTLNNISKNLTAVYCLARLLKSKSVIALTRLNNISDKMFASNVSMFLGVPVTVVKSSRKWDEIFDYEPGYRADSPGRYRFDISKFLSEYKRLLFNYCVVKYQLIHGC